MPGRKKILVIDGDDNLLASTRELLEKEGYKVFTHRLAFGSISAVDHVKPDLVLLDINMPGLSGDRLAYMLKTTEKTKDVPIVFYSSSDEDTLRKATAEHRARGYISKGNIFDLRSKIRDYLLLPDK